MYLGITSEMFSKTVFGLTIAILIQLVTSQCNQCGSVSSVKCTDDREFLFCDNGVAQTTGGTCPVGTVCANIANVCGPKAETKADCPNNCNVCHESRGYACISKTEYALCFDTDKISNITGTCAQNTVCSITDSAAGSRCAASAQLPSCPRSTPLPTEPPVTTPTPSPTNAPGNPTDQCTVIGTIGRYPVPGSNCQRFINCYAAGNVLKGNEYSCPGTTVFNKMLQLCVLRSTYNCPAGSALQG